MRRFVAALVVISVAALMACSGSPKRAVGAATPTAAGSALVTAAAPAATSRTLGSLPALGVELPASQIPWGQVGPGWILVTWSPAPALASGEPNVAPLTLYLLDPAGGRYPITTFPPLPPAGPGEPGHPAFLADWSGDGRHALFENYGFLSNDPQHDTMTEVDLATGAKQTFTVGAQGGVRAAYSGPTGQTLLLSTYVDYEHGSTLERVDLSGTKKLAFPADLGAAGQFNGAYLETADGTQLVLGGANGMAVVGNDGVIARQLPPPGPLTDCAPVRWWTATVILAECTHGKQDPGKYADYSSQLWQVPLAGGAPTALTAVNTGTDPGFGGDLGDGDAWQLPSGTFLQSAGGCSTGFLSRLTADKHTTAVSVPGVASDRSVFVIGASADKLVLRATMACGPGVSLLTYDPVANTSTVLLGPPVNGGGVQGAIIHPGP